MCIIAREHGDIKLINIHDINCQLIAGIEISTACSPNAGQNLTGQVDILPSTPCWRAHHTIGAGVRTGWLATHTGTIARRHESLTFHKRVPLARAEVQSTLNNGNIDLSLE